MTKKGPESSKELTFPYNWEPRDYQRSLWYKLECFDHEDEDGVNLFGAVCHRRWGKDLLGMNWCAKASQRRVGLYWHMLPTQTQGRGVVWNGITRDGRKFLDHFPGYTECSRGAKDAWVTTIRKDEMSLDFDNGSRYQVVGASNPDALVGTNPVGVVFSEWSVYDNANIWNFIRPILLENGGWALWLYTPRGHNHGYELKEIAEKNETGRWFYSAQGVEDSIHNGKRVVSDKLIEQERKNGMPEEMIQQEYYVSFDAPLIGSFYGDLLADLVADGRQRKIPIEANIVTHTWWDLGMHDPTAIWWIQVVGREIHVVDFYFSSGVGLDEYARVLKEKADERNLVYGEHLVPHDAKVRELGAPDGRDRLATLASLGVKCRVVKRDLIRDGINAVRQLLPKMWFDEERTKTAFEGLKAYRRKELEIKAPDGSPLFSGDPDHRVWGIHPADALRIGAMGLRSLRSARQTSVKPKNLGRFS